MVVRTISTAHARANFSDLLGSVHYTKEPVIVEKKGQPYAVVISPEEYERFRRAEEHDWILVEQMQTRTADNDPNAVLAEVTAEVEAVRQDMYAQREAADTGGH